MRAITGTLCVGGHVPPIGPSTLAVGPAATSYGACAQGRSAAAGGACGRCPPPSPPEQPGQVRRPSQVDLRQLRPENRNRRRSRHCPGAQCGPPDQWRPLAPAYAQHAQHTQLAHSRHNMFWRGHERTGVARCPQACCEVHMYAEDMRAVMLGRTRPHSPAGTRMRRLPRAS